MTINKNSVEQINVALLDMDKKIKSAISNGTSASDFKNLEASVESIKRNLNETTAGLESGKTYNINISGNAATADKATTATTAETATNANHAETATTAEAATTATTANKVANALTVNGKTYDGSTAVDAGVQTVANGGTGATTAKGAFMNLANGLSDDVYPIDTEHIIFKNTAGTNWGLYKLFQFWEYIKDKISSVLGLTKDNYGGKASTAGTADYANVPTGFVKGNQDLWGNQDGVFITDWQTFLGSELSNSGDISFRYNKKGQLNVIIDGVFYQNEGNYKLVDENSLKSIMKPNYTTGRFPAGVYKTGQTVSVSASITTTRGNPVYISYSGDYNSIGSGDTVPWISFNLYADDQFIQRTVVDNSVALNSDNTPFAGNALAVLSAGSHTIRLDAVLAGDVSGQVHFQEQDNLVNLVAFEL